MKNVHDDVTAKIIAELEKGAAPWVKPWRTVSSLMRSPHNAATRREYNGINVILLWITCSLRGFQHSGFLTFKQVKELGGHVRKGEKATEIVLVKRFTAPVRNEDGSPKLDDEGKPVTKEVPLLRGFHVFNVEQCDGLPDAITGVGALPAITSTDFDAWAQATGANIKHSGEKACYYPQLDLIEMPLRSLFHENANYDATLLHELGHWTGHEKRLNRDLKGRFSTNAYAAEELIAELTAAFLCADLGIDGDLRHAGYIQHWLKILREDNKAIFTAASQATKAAAYLKEQVAKAQGLQAAA